MQVEVLGGIKTNLRYRFNSISEVLTMNEILYSTVQYVASCQ